MLDFTEVFTKGYNMDKRDYETIIKCRNINFGYTNWIYLDSSFYDEENYMEHIIDNIIDINVDDNADMGQYSLFVKIIHYSRNPLVIHYMFNNGYVNYSCFENYFGKLCYTYHKSYCKCCPHKQFDKLVNYLTKISLNKFKGYYNIEKYYDMMTTMLLILKTQRLLPTAVVKHLIIPFVYQ